MAKTPKSRARGGPELAKCPSGIAGFDEITGGGLPKGRPTLVCGSAGCGKTLLAIEFLMRGAIDYDEPGVFFSFEESTDELATNVRSLGFDLDELIRQKKLVVEYVHVERSEIEETGEYDLEGLFVRLGHAIDTIKAKRVALDTLEALFAGLSNVAILRAELRRLFRWLKERCVTAVITAERGQGSLTRHGLEEYVSDCVIVLDHRVTEQVSTRRLRIVKYRGSTHGTNEFPFLIDAEGITVIPITSLGLTHTAATERVATGVARLDAMLGGPGVYRGTSVLISGTAGAGKTSVAAHFADATCRRGERCLYFAMEESPSQIVRNMRSIGLDLEPWIKKGLLEIHATRPTVHGLEAHLATMMREVRRFDAKTVVADPISGFINAGVTLDFASMVMRLVDFLKMHGVTAIFTSLTSGTANLESTDIGISSVIDTWILLRDIESNGERNRGLYVLKSRGMGHSNQICEFLLTDHGIEMADVYLGPDGMLTGSARVVQEAKETAAAVERKQETERRQRELERKRHEVENQIATLRAELEAEENEVQQLAEQAGLREERRIEVRDQMARMRQSDGDGARQASRRVDLRGGRK